MILRKSYHKGMFLIHLQKVFDSLSSGRILQFLYHIDIGILKILPKIQDGALFEIS